MSVWINVVLDFYIHKEILKGGKNGHIYRKDKEKYFIK